MALTKGRWTMKNFGTALKRALDANGRLPSELAKAAGVTGNAAVRWLKSIPFQSIKKPLANSASCEWIFCLLPSGYRRVHAVLLEIQTTGTPNEAAPAAPCPGLFPSCTGSKPTSRGRVGRPSLAIRPCGAFLVCASSPVDRTSNRHKSDSPRT